MIDSILKSRLFPPVLLLFGEEELLVDEGAQKIFDAASTMDQSGMSSEVIDGEGLAIDVVLSIARSYPMMSDKRILWIRHFDKVNTPRERKGADKLSEYLTNPSPSTILILSASIPSANGIHASMKRSESSTKKKIESMRYPTNVLLSKTSWIEFPRMRENQVATWLAQRASVNGLKLMPTVADFIIARSGTSLRELDMELTKVREYVGSREVVNEDDVLEVVGSGRQYNVFELQRAIGKKDAGMAITIMTKMLEAERQELLIITMLTRYFISLFKIIGCRSMSNNSDIARIAGIPVFAVGEYLAAAQLLGNETVDWALAELRRAESAIKSSSTEPAIILQMMIVKLFEPILN